ncbi:MAG: flagellar basal body L-ring protein FlgH [candidate division Zixibacteria bacterium]|nr:flagellar basal body L-ring protein FlgH [candidate division Zixibacteria bacterium]MBU1470990.1 flagellar basal body L-ring protein FlgH [candidate division Zixibacteria bacterium]MBU2625509.1 flagellar basal body L-ring protein FlgH [candidate division Zixibacteria bacterium]
MSILMRLIILSVAALLLVNPAMSTPLVGRSGSLFTDIKAHGIGDILTVKIYEDAQATNLSQTNVTKEGKFETSGGPGIGTLDFIPIFGASGENKNEYKGTGNNARAGNLKARMTVKVVAVRTNGDLVVEGNRLITINNDTETLTLSGIVRPQDVDAGNSVESYNIADAQISYRGKGPASTGSRPGIVIRFLNWIF